MISVLVKMIIWNSSMCGCKDNQICKSDEYLNTKVFSSKLRRFDKLILACEDEI